EGDLARGGIVHVQLHAAPPQTAEEEAAVIDDEAVRVLGRAVYGPDLTGGGVVHEQLGDEGTGYAAGAEEEPSVVDGEGSRILLVRLQEASGICRGVVRPEPPAKCAP